MDAFESLIAMLLRSEGYWTTTSFKVDLTKRDKAEMGIPSSPRWEIDILAYSGKRNEVVAVECKSFLDSTGVVFRDGQFEPPNRYKLFTRPRVRQRVLARLASQLEESGATAGTPTVTLALATGKIARKSDRAGLRRHFEDSRWRLYDEDWIRERLSSKSEAAYENDVAHVCAKLLLRDSAGDEA